MMRVVLATALVLAASPAFAQTAQKPAVDPHAGHMMMEMQQPAAGGEARQPGDPAR